MMKKRIHTSYARYVSKYKIEILITTKNAYEMNEERQIAEILAEANAYGCKHYVEQVAQRMINKETELEKYQQAYINVIYHSNLDRHSNA